jgi:hypothetical protein
MHLPDASWRRTMRPQSSTSSQFFGARWLDIDKFGLNTTPIIAICVSKVVLRHLKLIVRRCTKRPSCRLVLTLSFFVFPKQNSDHIQCLLNSPRQAALWTAGFPCTPYSMLGLRRLLHDENAQQLFETIRHLKTAEPAVSWLQKKRNLMTAKIKFL